MIYQSIRCCIGVIIIPIVLLAAPVASLAQPYCGIVDGKFIKDCPEPPLPTGTREEELRAEECRQLSSEIAGQVGLGSFSAIMKKDDLNKLYVRRCSNRRNTAQDNTLQCQRIAADLRGLAGTQTQSSLVKKSDLLRAYDDLCGESKQ